LLKNRKVAYDKGSCPDIGAKGVEGIGCQDGHHILIAQRTADDFICKIRMLTENEDLREKLTTNAYNLVVEKYSIPVAAKCLQDAIMQAKNQTEDVRH